MKRKTVAVVLVNDLVWGVFSSQKKAQRAIDLWFRTLTHKLVIYEVNYRLRTTPPKYLSDKDDSPSMVQSLDT